MAANVQQNNSTGKTSQGASAEIFALYPEVSSSNNSLKHKMNL